MSEPLSKPRPASPPPPAPAVVQLAVRMTEPDRERIRQLAEREGVTIQQLGTYAWSLMLDAYGLAPLTVAVS